MRTASDVSGSRGRGLWNDTKWFKLSRNKRWQHKEIQIATKEVMLTVVVVIVLGHEWKGCSI